MLYSTGYHKHVFLVSNPTDDARLKCGPAEGLAVRPQGAGEARKHASRLCERPTQGTDAVAVQPKS